jgi:hypothetical protein
LLCSFGSLLQSGFLFAIGSLVATGFLANLGSLLTLGRLFHFGSLRQLVVWFYLARSQNVDFFCVILARCVSLGFLLPLGSLAGNGLLSGTGSRCFIWGLYAYLASLVCLGLLCHMGSLNCSGYLLLWRVPSSILHRSIFRALGANAHATSRREILFPANAGEIFAVLAANFT